VGLGLGEGGVSVAAAVGGRQSVVVGGRRGQQLGSRSGGWWQVGLVQWREEEDEQCTIIFNR